MLGGWTAQIASLVNIISVQFCKRQYSIQSNLLADSFLCMSQFLPIFSGGIWVSHARIRLHKLLMKVVKIGGQPYHVDNDSVIFSATKKQFDSLNLPIGISSGKLKEEIT